MSTSVPIATAVSLDTISVHPCSSHANTELLPPRAASEPAVVKSQPSNVGNNTASSPERSISKKLVGETLKQGEVAESSCLSNQDAKLLSDIQEDEQRKGRVLEQYRQIHEQSFLDISVITGEELLELISSHLVGVDRDVVLVDCRSAAERQVSIIPGAISQAQLEDNLNNIKDKDIIAYCASGRRSGNFVKTLTQKHAEFRVRNFAGSLVYWMHLGGPLVDGQHGLPTNRLNLGGSGWLPYLPKSRCIEFVADTS